MLAWPRFQRLGLNLKLGLNLNLASLVVLLLHLLIECRVHSSPHWTLT